MIWNQNYGGGQEKLTVWCTWEDMFCNRTKSIKLTIRLINFTQHKYRQRSVCQRKTYCGGEWAICSGLQQGPGTVQSSCLTGQEEGGLSPHRHRVHSSSCRQQHLHTAEGRRAMLKNICANRETKCIQTITWPILCRSLHNILISFIIFLQILYL